MDGDVLADDDRVFVGLRKEITLEIGMAKVGGVGHIDVGHSAAGRLIDRVQ